jgi:hypothetical protein
VVIQAVMFVLATVVVARWNRQVVAVAKTVEVVMPTVVAVGGSSWQLLHLGVVDNAVGAAVDHYYYYNLSFRNRMDCTVEVPVLLMLKKSSSRH